MASFSCATAKDDGIYCSVREHPWSICFYNALWDTLSHYIEDSNPHFTFGHPYKMVQTPLGVLYRVWGWF